MLARPSAVSYELSNQGGNWCCGAAALQLDIDEGTTINGFENLSQCRNSLAQAGVELADLSEGVARQQATTIGCPFEFLIVKDDKFAIDELHVDLDASHAEFECPADGAQRILRLVTGSAAVADGDEIRGWSVGPQCQSGSHFRWKRDSLDAVIAEWHPQTGLETAVPAGDIGSDPAIERERSEALQRAWIGGVEELQHAAVVGRDEEISEDKE